MQGGARISLCGELSVEAGGERIDRRLPGRQGRLLFAHLVVNRTRAVPRDELVDVLWPEGVPDSAATTLKSLISRLRRAIAPLTIDGRSALRLRLPEDTRIDVDDAAYAVALAARRLNTDRPAEALEAAEAAQGWIAAPALPGISGAWADELRRDVESLRLRALEIAATASLRLGQDAEPAARELVAADPFRETGHRLLIEALRARGDIAAALVEYEWLRRMLREELGVAPSPQTQELHAQLVQEHVRTHLAAPRVAVAMPAPLVAVGRRPLVGRERERAAAEGLLVPSDRRLVVLSGEVGIGKTRLAAAVAETVRQNGTSVIFGRCDEESSLPYQPLAEALRDALAEVDDQALAAFLARSGPELALLVPDVARRAPDLPRAARVDDLHVLYDSVGAALDVLAGDGGVLLIVDDLHYVDSQTARLIRNLLRRPGRPLCVLATMRSSDPRADAAGLVARLRRDAACEEIGIGPLEPDELAQLAAAWLGPDGSAVAARLMGWTGGNPLYATEILREVAAGGVALDVTLPVPAGVSELLGERVERLPAALREVVLAAAVLGREFRVDVLAAAMRRSPQQLLEELQPAVAAGLLLPPAADDARLAFTHDIVREGLYAMLTVTERARLHRRAAETLEAGVPPGGSAPVAAIASHFSRAIVLGTAPQAFDYGVRAGDRAVSVLSFAEGAAHYAAALAHAETAGVADHRRCAVQLAEASALGRAGHTPAARERFLAAADAARRLRRPDLLARAALGYGAGRRFGFVEQVDTKLVELLEEALALVDEGDTSLRPRLLAQLASELYYVTGPHRRIELAESAIALARAGGEPRTLAETLSTAVWATRGPDRAADVGAAAAELEQQARRLRTAEWLFTASHLAMFAALERGDGRALRDAVRRCNALAENLRQPFYSWLAGSSQALVEMLAGRLDEGEQLMQRSLAAWPEGAGGPGAMFGGMQLLFSYWARGRLGELRDSTRMFAAHYEWIPAWRCALAFLEAETGHHDDAALAVQALVAPDLRAIPRDGNWLLSAALLAVACVRLGDAARAAVVEAAIAPYRDRQIVAAGGALSLGSMSMITGMVAALLGRYDDAVQQLTQAVEANRALGAPPLEDFARAELAAASAARA